MKVLLTYHLLMQHEVELTPEEYLNARANYSESALFPDNAVHCNMAIDRSGREELNEYWYNKGAK